jgi:hypothetical protein
MATFSTPGTPVPSHITFNSGVIDFGNERQVMVDNIALSLEYSLADLLVLGSIKPQYIARHTQKVSLTAKLKSFSPGLVAMVAGSSNGTAPLNILTLDGQPTMTNPVATLFDASGNQYQYQFQGAVFKSSKLTAKMEDYAEFDFELEAMDLTILSTPSL